eukprot:COSAG06_NODE_265_length_18834_cov_10.938991_4_plen_45_part_00
MRPQLAVSTGLPCDTAHLWKLTNVWYVLEVAAPRAGGTTPARRT